MRPTPLCAVLVLLLLTLAAPAFAATLTVTKLADTNDGFCDSDCSLREAIAVASAGDEIEFDVTVVGTIALNSTLLIDETVTINGPNIGSIALDGVQQHRVVEIVPGVNVTLSNLIIENGIPPDDGGTCCPEEAGSGICNSGTATLTDVVVRDNVIFGGGICNDGSMTLERTTITGNYGVLNSAAFLNSGTLTILDSVVSNNRDEQADGQFIRNTGVLTVSDSYITNNSGWISNTGTAVFIRTSIDHISGEGFGGIRNGNTLNSASGDLTMIDCELRRSIGFGFAGLINQGTARIFGTTIEGNIGNSGGGNIRNEGQMVLANSTVSGNISGSQFWWGTIHNAGTLSITHSTIAANRVESASSERPAIYNSGMLEISGSIVSGTVNRHSGTPVASCMNLGTIVSLGHNIYDDDSCGLTGTGDVIADPLLGPLASNGGPTPTHMPQSDSPAIDAAPPADCVYDDDLDPLTPDVPLPFDQRGVVRPQGSGCDIGSVETLPIVTAQRVIDCDAGQELATLMHGETFVLDLNSPGAPSCVGIGVLTDVSKVTGDGSVGHDYTPAPGETVAEPYEGENFAPYAFTDELGWAVLDEIAACNCDHPERGDLTYPGTHTLTSIPCSGDSVSWVAGDKAAQCAAAGGAVGATFTTQLDVVPEPGTTIGMIFGTAALAGLAAMKRGG